MQFRLFHQLSQSELCAFFLFAAIVTDALHLQSLSLFCGKDLHFYVSPLSLVVDPHIVTGPCSLFLLSLSISVRETEKH